MCVLTWKLDLHLIVSIYITIIQCRSLYIYLTYHLFLFLYFALNGCWISAQLSIYIYRLLFLFLSKIWYNNNQNKKKNQALTLHYYDSILLILRKHNNLSASRSSLSKKKFFPLCYCCVLMKIFFVYMSLSILSINFV